MLSFFYSPRFFLLSSFLFVYFFLLSFLFLPLKGRQLPLSLTVKKVIHKTELSPGGKGPNKNLRKTKETERDFCSLSCSLFDLRRKCLVLVIFNLSPFPFVFLFLPFSPYLFFFLYTDSRKYYIWTLVDTFLVDILYIL